MRIKQILETAGATSSGSIASVASPIGATQKRAGSMFKGKKTKKKFYEGKMKDLAYDIQHLDAGNFMKKYGHPKDYFTKKLGKPPVSEAELQEDDLILVPGQLKGKDRSFIPHDKDRRDHEVEMARSDLYAAAKDAMRIYKMLKDRTEDEGLMGWQQSYITLASDYLNSVADSLEHDAKVAEMTGGVITGGMSNFEESQIDELKKSTINDYLSKQSAAVRFGKDEKPKKIPSWKVAAGKVNPDSEMGKYAKIKAVDLAEAIKQGVCPHCKGEMVSEELMNEKQDACYHKVKSRYKVWPSAYASGALVKCRKVGAKNWGNKSK